jgi:AraC-like DNA-binding protein/mannose-6-phosphate isomerase-like protein (cupin superfamily)
MFNNDLVDESLKRLNGCRFNTESQPANQRHEWLREVIGKEYAHVEVSPPKAFSLFNDMQIYPLSRGVRFSPIRSNPIALERLPAEPSTVQQDCYFAVVLLSGAYKLEQGGREAYLKPGDMTIYDATEPHKITIPRPFSKLIVSIPKIQIDSCFNNVDKLTATIFKGDHHQENSHFLSRLCIDMHQMEKEAFQDLSLPIIEMIKENLAENGADENSLSSLRALSLLRVKQFIQFHLDDDELDAMAIARGVKLSSRYINELFQHQETSLMRHLTAKRLERSQQYLSNPLYSALSTTDIAFRCGFKNYSHFSRIFKTRYGCSPTDYRSRVRDFCL